MLTSRKSEGCRGRGNVVSGILCYPAEHQKVRSCSDKTVCLFPYYCAMTACVNSALLQSFCFQGYLQSVMKLHYCPVQSHL